MRTRTIDINGTAEALEALYSGEVDYPINNSGLNIRWFNDTESGITVNQETAITHNALYSGIRIIGESLASLPFEIQQIYGDEIKTISHPILSLLNHRINRNENKVRWIERQIKIAVLYGFSASLILRDSNYKPIELLPVNPEKIAKGFNQQGEQVYIIQVSDTINKTVRQHDLFIVDAFCSDSIVENFRELLGIGLAAERFSAKWFSGSNQQAIIEIPDTLDIDEAGKAYFRSEYMRLHAGIDNAFSVPVFDEGVKLRELKINPADGQMIETYENNTRAIGRILGIPLHLLGMDESTNAKTRSQQDLEFAKYTLASWATRIESEATDKLLSEQEKSKGYIVNLNLDARLRGDMETRSVVSEMLLKNGIITTNEARKQWGYNPVENGDSRLVPLNYVSASEANTEPAHTETAETAESSLSASEAEAAETVEKLARSIFDQSTADRLLASTDQVELEKVIYQSISTINQLAEAEAGTKLNAINYGWLEKYISAFSHRWKAYETKTKEQALYEARRLRQAVMVQLWSLLDMTVQWHSCDEHTVLDGKTFQAGEKVGKYSHGPIDIGCGCDVVLGGVK